ncbi:MAG: murein biosynthesis integral membrane protein MurJ [Ignavibacteriales bacterium]
MNSTRRLSPALIVAGANIILAVVAFVREAVLGATIGTEYSADAFALSLYLADAQANTIFYSSIVFAAIPVLSGHVVDRRRDSLLRTLNSATGTGVAVSAALWTVNASAARLLISTLGAGFPAPERSLATSMFLLLLPLIPCYILSAVFISGLQACSEFGVPAFGPVVLNVLFIAGLGATMSHLGPAGLSVSYSVGAVAMLLLQAVTLHVKGLPIRPSFDICDPGLRQMVTALVPIALVQVFNQPTYLVERILAGRFGEGGVASLTYAFKVSQIPVWVFVAALGAVAFPAMSRFAHLNDVDGMSGVLEKAAELTMAITLPSAVVFRVFAREVTAAIFMRGAFGAASLASTSQVLRGYALAPVCHGLLYLLLRLCYACRDTATPIIATLAGSAVTVLADLILTPSLGLEALGFGSAIGLTVSAAFITWRVRTRLAREAPRRLALAAGSILVCCIIMLMVMFAVEGCLPVHVEAITEEQRLFRTGALFSAGFASYATAYLFLGSGALRFRGVVASNRADHGAPRE